MVSCKEEKRTNLVRSGNGAEVKGSVYLFREMGKIRVVLLIMMIHRKERKD